MKPFLFLILFIALFTRVERFCHKATDGFQLYKIFPPQKSLSLEHPLSPEIAPLLQPPFHYLGSGGQSYVFLSSDKKHVLKVFKYHHLDEKKTNKLHESLSIAAEVLKAETGVTYLHLYGDQTAFASPLTLIDKIGCSHTIDPTTLTFVIQKTAEPFYSALDRMIQEGKQLEVRRCLDALHSLIAKRCEKGIGDADFRLSRNCGFIDGEVVITDLGLFFHDESLQQEDTRNKQIAKEFSQINRFFESRKSKCKTQN